MEEDSFLKKAGRWFRRLFKAADAAKTLNDLNDRQNTLYRGLSGNDVRNLEEQGAILPDDPKGGLTPEEHALGHEGSQFVSFTTDRETAVRFATRGPDPSGIVVTIDAQGAAIAGVLVQHDTTDYSERAHSLVDQESEVLIEGAIPRRALRWIEEVEKK